MTSVRALIADDERLMREQLRGRLAEAWSELDIVAEAANGQQAVELAARHRPDLVFLDIRMPGMSGIEAAQQIAALPREAGGWAGCEIVFITASDQHAVEAFEQGVVDYVLKPAEPERLRVTVERLRRRLAQHGPVPAEEDMRRLLQQLGTRLAAPPRQHLKWIQASVGQVIQLIPVDEVLFFISDEKYTRLQTATQEALIRKPIKELIQELDPQQFWQIHRSTLVHARAIAGVSRDLRGRQVVSVKGRPETLEVSRSFYGLFKGM